MITSAQCSDGSGDGTNATMPLHIWMHSVELSALRNGASSEAVKAVIGKAVFWYCSGEPVWMAADGLLRLAKGHEQAQRDDSDRRVLLGVFRRDGR